MDVTSPEQICEAFCGAFNRRDAQALIALYHDDAVFTSTGESVLRGRAAIAEVMQHYAASDLRMEIACAACHVSGNTALVRSDWRLFEPGGAVKAEGASAEVLRLGADGHWRFQIDDASFASRVMKA